MSTVVEERRRGSMETSPGKIVLVRALRVYLDTAIADTPRNARLNCGVSTNDAHPEDAGVLARTFQVQPVAEELGKRAYDVTINYESPDPGQSFGDPVNDDPVIRFAGRSKTIIAIRDKDGTPLLNSAYDWFNPPLELDVHPATITIERNESTAVSATMRDFRDSVNSAGITIAGHTLAVRQALLSDWQATSFRRDTFFRWRHVYTIDIADVNWDEALVDQGLYYLDGASPPIKRPVIVGGEPATEPQRLNGSGGVLDPNTSPVGTQFREFRVRKELAWSTLNLPTALPS